MSTAPTSAVEPSPAVRSADPGAATATAPAVARRLRRGDPGWPERLEHLGDPPAQLWLLGEGLGEAPAVAVVGARCASLAALVAARSLGLGLARLGATVVSGLARGVDAAAHRGALDAGGRSVAVLGCGVDVVYPAANRELRRRLACRGTLLSEDPPGTAPEPWRFPRRNRLIAALAVAVVVVEAGQRSGALSTARHAADLGREVLACPGSAAMEECRGSNHLLRDGAAWCESLRDVVLAVPELARLPGSAAAPVESLVRLPTRLDLPAGSDPAAGALLELLGASAADRDSLALALALAPPRLARLVSRLELAGLLRSRGDGRLEAVPAAAGEG